MRIKQDKLQSLRRALNLAEMYGDSGIAEKAKLTQATARRIMDGSSVTDKFIFRLLRTLLALPEGELSEEGKGRLAAAVADYCEEGPEVAAIAQMRKPQSPLAVMSVYVKFLHLRDGRTSAPVYRKFIHRLDRKVDVFDEFVIVRTLLFSAVPEPFEMVGHTKGITDLQPAYPPRSALLPLYIGRHDAPDSVGHFETEPEPLAQGAFTIVNGFQEGNTVIGTLVVEKCVRLVLVVDMSSLPNSGEFLVGPPLGFHVRKTPTSDGEERLAMRVDKSTSGAFILDTKQAHEGSDGDQGWNPERHKLLKHDRCEMRFLVNWDALA